MDIVASVAALDKMNGYATDWRLAIRLSNEAPLSHPQLLSSGPPRARIEPRLK
jgi:hypothetical protein